MTYVSMCVYNRDMLKTYTVILDTKDHEILRRLAVTRDSSISKELRNIIEDYLESIKNERQGNEHKT